MRVVSSEIVSQIVQIDGRVSITERHTYDSGFAYLHDYIADADLNFQAIADQRAANINAEIDRREREVIAAAGFEAPITVRAFLDLIPLQTRTALRELAKTNAAMDDALEYLKAGPEVFKAVAAEWLNSLVTAGVIAQSVVDGILAEWAVRYG